MSPSRQKWIIAQVCKWRGAVSRVFPCTITSSNQCPRPPLRHNISLLGKLGSDFLPKNSVLGMRKGWVTEEKLTQHPACALGRRSVPWWEAILLKHSTHLCCDITEMETYLHSPLSYQEKTLTNHTNDQDSTKHGAEPLQRRMHWSQDKPESWESQADTGETWLWTINHYPL